MEDDESMGSTDEELLKAEEISKESKEDDEKEWTENQ